MMKQSLILLVALFASCASAPSNPMALGDQIIADLDAGLLSQAENKFEAVANDAKWRESLYPRFFAEARERYESGDFEGASVVLRFSVDQYSQASAMREALLYSLFQLRAQKEHPDAALVQELELVAQDFLDSGGPSLWTDLIAAQTAIDLGHADRARNSYQRFVANWNGEPTELTTYVDDLGRYLNNPPTLGEEH